MQVIVPQSELKRHHACDVYLKSTEWDSERDALVYSDWDATVTRLLSTRAGMTYLDWLVAHDLVPMTRAEFVETRASIDPAFRGRRHG